jgi:acyl-CoA thioesterase-1
VGRRREAPVAAILVALLAVGVVGGTGYAWARWNDQVATDTDVESVVDPGSRDEDLPDAPGLPTAEPEPEPAYEPPTFSTLTPTANRPRPVLLLVGDGWAAGDGASGDDASYAARLGSELGWDVRVVAEPGASYVSPGESGATVSDLWADAPLAEIDPDAVLVQADYAGPDPDVDAVTSAIAELGDRIAADLPDAPVVAISSFRPDGVSAKDETAMTQAWRAVDDTLVLRPTKQGFADLPTGPAGNPLDAGHELIATSLEEAFREAGLVPGG